VSYGLEYMFRKLFIEINPLFDELEELREQGELWRNISNKEERFYVPLLEAFIRN